MNIRQLDVKAVATQDFKSQYGENWRKIIKEVIQDASEIFKKEFGIELILKSIKIRNYYPESILPYFVFDYVKCLQRQEDLQKFDAIIAFTEAPFLSHGDSSRALAAIKLRERLILLGNPLHLSLFKFCLVHELGHLFGAEHTEDEKSYMNGEMDIKACFFEEASKKTILDNKQRQFR